MESSVAETVSPDGGAGGGGGGNSPSGGEMDGSALEWEGAGVARKDGVENLVATRRAAEYQQASSAGLEKSARRNL